MNWWAQFAGETQRPSDTGSRVSSSPDRNRSQAEPGFVAQFQQALGENDYPDAEFFVECWTSGADEAVNRFVSRQHFQKECERQPASSYNFISFSPMFPAEEFVFQHERMHNLNAPGTAAPAAKAEGNEDCRPDWAPGTDIEGPFTVEQARRLLGVAAGSSAAAIKTAYRHLVRMYHPDHLERSSAEARRTATDKMTAINQAYGLLCRDRLRQPAGVPAHS